MRRYLFATLAIIAFLPMSRCAPDESAIKGEMVEAGEFEVGPGQPGTRETHFTSHGTTITARPGLKFGFRCRITGVPHGPTFTVKTTVTHPPFKTRDGSIETHYQLDTTMPVRDGVAMSVTGYSFDHPEELAPGVWTFEHAYRGKPLVRQSFTIVAQ